MKGVRLTGSWAWLKAHPQLAAEGGLLALWVLGNGARGLLYRPFQDDWFYIGRAATRPCGTPYDLYLIHGMYGYRPLSFWIETVVWSHFWPNLVVPWMFLLALMVFTALSARRLVQALTGVPSWWGTAALLFWPGAVEGQYWVVGATGIVPCLAAALGGFWAVVAAERRMKSGQSAWAWLLVACTAFLVSDLCYEQAWGVVLILLVLLAWQFRSHFIKLLAPGALALGATAVWYEIHRAWLISNGRVPVTDMAELMRELATVAQQVGFLWTEHIKDAALQSLTLSRLPLIWWVPTLLVAGLVGLWVARVAPGAAARRSLGFIWIAVGFVVWVASYMPWMATQYGFVADRSVTIAVIGAAAVLEGLLLLLSQVLPRRMWPMLVGGVLAVALAMGTNLRGQDTQAYVASGNLDIQMSTRALAMLNAHHVTRGVLVTSPSQPAYWVPWDYPFHNHVQNEWSEPWGIQFMLEDLSGGHNGYVVLLPGTAAQAAHAVGVVATLSAPSRADLRAIGAKSGIVLEVAIGGMRPHVIQAVWYGPVRQPADSGPGFTCPPSASKS